MSIEDVGSILDRLKVARIENKKIEESAGKAEENAVNSKHTDGKTRSALTITFLWFFFCLLIFSCLFVLWYNNSVVSWALELKSKGVDDYVQYLKPLELEKVLSIMITALGTSLGFIIGYYFKDKENHS
ncbi:hypothetical protein D9F02_20505 [Escherichia coli]|nr:hypothetical protein [Escherichia coli]MGJ69744.1 hypothetical protein [Escherichia coli]MIA55967.1 hypothetical protein [Escherichia coli]